MTSKQSYHPALLVAFYLDFLPSAVRQHIPRSTLHDWKHKDIETYFGKEWFLENSQLFATLQQVAVNNRLLQINKLLLRCMALKRFMSRHKSALALGARDVCQVVVTYISRAVRWISLKKCLSLIQLDARGYALIRHASSACSGSILRSCWVKHPWQLLQTEILRIKDYASRPQWLHWPLASIYHQMRRDGVAGFHLHTFYKYIRLLKLARYLPRHRRKNHVVGIRAAKPLELLHVDITYFRTLDGVTSYIYVITDNYSRAILYAQAFLERRASLVIQAFEVVFQKYYADEPHDVTILSDDGSENTLLHTLQAKNIAIKYLIAQKDIPQSNSMVEASHKSLKYRGLYLEEVENHIALQPLLDKAVADHSQRPHHVLDGLAPIQVLTGVPYESIFPKVDDTAQRLERIKSNKQTMCCKQKA